MDKNILKTLDGSHTIYSQKFDSTYHSTNGAIQESNHVFIKHGLEYFSHDFINKNIRILEYGFGTGLNALLSLKFANSNKKKLNYIGLEAYPIELKNVNELNYNEIIDSEELEEEFLKMHSIESDKKVDLSDYFSFSRIQTKFEKFEISNKFDIIFYDVFSPDVQGFLWERPFLDSVYDKLDDNGILITYGAKGTFKRALKSIGFEVQNPPGPPGKREITRAVKIDFKT